MGRLLNFPIDVPGPATFLSRYAGFLGWLPWFLRRWILVNKAKPSQRPDDVQDVLGNDPYKIDEIVHGKVWKIAYEYADNLVAHRSRLKFVDFSSEESINAILAEAAKDGRESHAQATEDIERMKEVNNLSPEEVHAGGYVKAASKNINMYVVKLTSGDVILYCPVHIHRNSTLSNFLDKLGPVRWIIIGSSYHTLFLPSAMKTFPEAMVVGATGAELKLKAVSAFIRGKLDYDVTKSEDRCHLADKFDVNELELLFIAGDVFSQAIIVRASNALLEADVIYSHHPGCTCVACNLPITSFPTWNIRLRLWTFRSNEVTHPDYGLPYYRFSLMNPDSVLYNMLITPPHDGVNILAAMAGSLRTALASSVDVVCSVHSSILTPDDYKKSVDRNWYWLDGKSLLNQND